MAPVNYGYMTMMAGGPQPSMYGNPYYGMPFSPSAEPTMQANDGRRSPSSAQDEHQQLLDKVAGVLPDINRLLNSYKETHGQLSAKELLVKQADMSHNEQLSKLRVELDANKKEYEKVIQNLVDDRSRLGQELATVRQRVTDLERVEAESKALRTEVEALQVNKKDLTEGFDTIRRSKEEMQATRLAHEKEIESLKKALQVEKDLRQRSVADEKDQAKEQMDLKQKEFQKAIGDHKISYAKVQMELTSLLSKHQSQKKDLEIARSSAADYKIKLDLQSRELEDAVARHGQDIQSIQKKHEEERERLAQDSEERNAKMDRKHITREKIWQQDLKNIGAELESVRTENQRLRDELELVKRRKDAEKLQKSEELVESLALWRTKSDELQQQNQNLDRVLQGLGYATEVKSKGDDFL
jgi:serine/arginine repetitive matrix protein 2